MINEPIEADLSENYEIKAKETSDEILGRLNNFIASQRDILKIGKLKNKYNLVDVVQNNKWLFLLSYYIFFSLLILIVITSLIVPPSIIISLMIFIGLLVFVLGMWICFKFWNSIKEIRNKAIDRVAGYPLRYYYEIIEELGVIFNQECLNREEIRFKLAINERKKSSNMLKLGSLLISILIVVFAVIILGPPDENTESKYLYGTIVGLSGVTFVTKAILDMLYEWLDQKDIDVYNKCLLILQKAQNIAREEELDEQRAYDEAIAANDEVIPFEQAILEIEQNR